MNDNNITIRCCKCRKEIWTDIDGLISIGTTIQEATEALCSDCLLNRIKNMREEDGQ